MFITNWAGKWQRRPFRRSWLVIISEQFYAATYAWCLCYNVYDDFHFSSALSVRRSFCQKLELSSFHQAASEWHACGIWKQRQFTKLWATVVTLLERENALPAFSVPQSGSINFALKTAIQGAVLGDQSLNWGSWSSNRKFLIAKCDTMCLDTTWSNPHRPQKLQKKVPAIGIPLTTNSQRDSDVPMTGFNYMSFATFSTSGCTSRLILLFSK